MMQPSRILIVDDESMNVDLLGQQLADLGYETVVAGGGQEALDKVAEQAPDLILLDVMMPGIDGFEVCRRLKASDETRLIPIVIMTALHEIDDRVKGIEAGADEFLTKPVDKRELQARIKTSLKLKHTIDKKLGEAEQARDHFAKFVPEVVKRLVAENPEAPELGKKEQDVAVLFVDICDFTSLTEQMTLGDLSRLVENYFSAFLDEIDRIGGDISAALGDGLMIIFHGRDQPIDHARMAADAAIALMRVATALNAGGGGTPVALHMGISSGTAAVGSTRFEGLRGSQWVFTADGLVLTIAARLTGRAGAGEIFTDHETARRLGDGYPLKKEGIERLKNVAAPVDVYCIGIPNRTGEVRREEG